MALLFQLKQKLSQGFSAFWTRWPRKVAKLEAQKAWTAVVTPDDEAPIHQALDWQLSVFAQRQPEHIPHAATWIRGRRWEDEPPKPTTTRNPATVTPLRSVQTPHQQQQEAVTRIQHLMHKEGKTLEEAKRIVGIEQGWIKEDPS